MDDTLRYAGQRVIVSGAARGLGAAIIAILVDLGAEVHALSVDDPPAAGLASRTRCEPHDPDGIAAAVARIGSVVNALFVCDAGGRHLAEAAVPHMVEGSAIAWVAEGSAAAALTAFGAEWAPTFARRGIRCNGVDPGGIPVSGPARIEELAWLLVLVNSRRASALTGQRIAGPGAPTAVRSDPGALTPEPLG